MIPQDLYTRYRNMFDLRQPERIPHNVVLLSSWSSETKPRERVVQEIDQHDRYVTYKEYEHDGSTFTDYQNYTKCKTSAAEHFNRRLSNMTDYKLYSRDL